jgi:protein-S-isoprenylcysteine O-methyltransferase Ste14
MLGLVLAAASLSLLFATLAWFAAIGMRTPIEEAKLIERFGDEYRSYMRRTGRYLPRPGTTRGHGGTSR